MKKLFSLFLVAFMAMSLAAAPATQLKKLSDAPAQSANQQRALRLINSMLSFIPMDYLLPHTRALIFFFSK